MVRLTVEGDPAISGNGVINLQYRISASPVILSVKPEAELTEMEPREMSGIWSNDAAAGQRVSSSTIRELKGAFSSTIYNRNLTYCFIKRIYGLIPIVQTYPQVAHMVSTKYLTELINRCKVARRPSNSVGLRGKIHCLTRTMRVEIRNCAFRSCPGKLMAPSLIRWHKLGQGRNNEG